MDVVYFIVGALLGGVVVAYVVRLRYRQSHVQREEYDRVQTDLNASIADLRIAHDKISGQAQEIRELEGFLTEEREKVLSLSKGVSSLTSNLESSEALRSTLQLERDSFKGKLEDAKADAETLRTKLATAEAELGATKTSLDEAKEMVRSRDGELKERRQEISGLETSLADRNATVSNLQEKLETQKGEIESIRKQSEAEFKIIANQILEEKSSKFTEVNKTNLETILKPLGDNIEGFKKKVEETYDRESKERFSLGEKVAELVTLNKRISEEANNLTHALEGSSKIQGDWGEWILESILERSGLVKGREFQVQEFMRDDNGNILKNEDGTKMRPDVIINYPDKRKVIVDSKVSLVAYKRLSFADTPEEQNTHLQEHLASIKKHINDLSAKNYPDFAQGLDFVMMFIPIEPAFLVAMHADPELWSYAYSKRVLLISPTNLIAVIKLIADLWIRERQSLNAIEIAERGGALYDKFVGFVEALSDIGSNIEKTQKSYDTALGRLKIGRGNLLTQVETLKKLGVKARKNLPIGFEADLEDDEPRLLDDDSDDGREEATPTDDQVKTQQESDEADSERVDAF